MADVCPFSVFLDATQYGVDLVLEESCVSSSPSSSSKLLPTPAPLGSDTVPRQPTLSPSTTSNISQPSSGQDDPQGSLDTATAPTSGVAESSEDEVGARAGVGVGQGSSSIGIAVVCFLLGALVVAVPAAMYSRRSRYEAMREMGHRYEMT